MFLSLLSGECFATFPHVLKLSGYPSVPNPILESQLLQSSSLLARKPILTLLWDCLEETALKPSMLQLCCREAWEPISVFHEVLPSEVGRYCQRSASTRSQLPGLWRENWYFALQGSSFRGRSWWRVCPSRSSIWSPVCQIQFVLLQH